jgi:hypothetical protein
VPEHTSVDSRHARALADPVRAGIVAALGQGPRTIASLARDLDVSRQRVARHARALAGMGLVRVSDDHPRTCELLREPVVWEKAWSELPLPVRRETIANSLTHIFAAASASVDAGGFDRPDCYLTRTTLRMSEELWGELAEQFGETVRRLDAAEEDPGGTPATVVTMLFSGDHTDMAPPESPPEDFDDAEARVRSYGVVEEMAALIASDEPVPWDRVAALFERGRLLARAAASLGDARQPSAAERR